MEQTCSISTLGFWKEDYSAPLNIESPSVIKFWVCILFLKNLNLGLLCYVLNLVFLYEGLLWISLWHRDKPSIHCQMETTVYISEYWWFSSSQTTLTKVSKVLFWKDKLQVLRAATKISQGFIFISEYLCFAFSSLCQPYLLYLILYFSHAGLTFSHCVPCC